MPPLTPAENTLFDNDLAEHLSETSKSWLERPVLIMLDGTDANRRYRIDKPVLTIGRDVTSDVILNDTRCSRHHARLTYHNFDNPEEQPRVELTDLSSTNGCFVNGVRLGEQLLYDRDKILIGSSLFGFFLRDKFELEADQRLYFLARNDALTGLLNRGIFNVEIQKEFERARRYGRSMSLVLLDIDHFKRFNDNYGHQVGDAVLQELGRIIQANIRSNDIGARYGGEEFAIILPETNLEGALIQAERLRIAVSEHPFASDATSMRLTVSLGVAAVEPDAHRLEDFIKQADQALYQAKAAGRNRICWTRDGQFSSGSVLQQA